MGRPSTPQKTEEENGTVGATMDSGDLLFSPAEHTDSIKRRKDKKRRERQDKTPRTKNTQKTEGQVPVESRQGTPPMTRPPKAKEVFESQEEEDVWYAAKWWMFCFGNLDSMTPKR